MADARREVEVLTTEGSYDNAELLRNGGADLALLQSDVAYLEHYNRRPFLALASVHTEPIHVIAFRGLELRRVSDLLLRQERFVVAVGAPGSGSNAHALAVLDELGLPPHRLATVNESVDEAARGLRNREIDLAFVTIAVPSQAVRELAEERIISLLDIDRDIAQRLRRRNPFFVGAEIPYAAYDAGEHNVQTLGTRTLLVARPDLPGPDVDLVLDALYSVTEKGTLNFLRDLPSSSGFDELAIPLHPAASAFHARRAGRYGRWFESLRTNALPLILLGATLVAVSRLSRFAYFVHQFVFGRVLVSLVAVWLAGSAAIYLFEHGKNSAFRSFGSSAIAILHYLFSGLESKYPVTPGGNVVAILVLSLGVGLVTLFTATLVTLLVEQALNIRTLRSKPVPFLKLTGHTVITGWSGRTMRIIGQLRSPDLRTKPTVIVIAPRKADTRVADRRSFRGVWVVEGDPAKAATLRKADIGSAAHAVVLASGSTNGGEDLPSICATLAIEREAPAIHTIVEARAATGIEHLTRSRADEIVDTTTLAERLVSQCVITPGVARVFDELLSFGADSQEIYILPIGRHLDRSGFRAIGDRLRSCDAILLGFWRKGEEVPRLNPRGADCETLLRAADRDGDRLVVLADSPKALTSFRARIRQRRQAMSSEDETATRPARSVKESAEGVEPRSIVPRRVPRIGICGWNDEARAVVRQLQESVIATHQDFEITVIDGPKPEEVETECTRNVRFVFGDPTRSRTLANAGVGEMTTLVVLADHAGTDLRRPSASPGGQRDDGESASDHRALVICLAAREVNPHVHLVVEVLQSENQEHFDRIAEIEIVSVEDLSEKLLAQAVISPGITGVFLELLTATEDSNEVYVVPVPARWEGLPFSQIAAKLDDADPPVIALGYRTKPGDGSPVIVLNPRHRKSIRHGVADWRQQRLGGGDELVVMAYEEPSW